MSKVCEVTGVGPKVGNNVSHAKNRNKRRFLPNLQKKRFWFSEEKRYIKLRISIQGIRLIDKLGIKAVLKKIKARLNKAVRTRKKARIKKKMCSNEG